MALAITCPAPSQIPDIPVVACPTDLGQIQKFGLQRLYSSGTTLNSQTAANFVLAATWTTLLGATDSTKVQFSPLIGNVIFTPAEPNRAGEGPETPDGTGVITSLGKTPVTFELIQPHPSIGKALKLYLSEGYNLGIYLVNQDGKMICKVDDPTTPTVCYPIPIRSWFLTDRTGSNIDSYDKQPGGWTFLPGWSDNLAIFTPSNFDALTFLSGS